MSFKCEWQIELWSYLSLYLINLHEWTTSVPFSEPTFYYFYLEKPMQMLPNLLQTFINIDSEYNLLNLKGILHNLIFEKETFFFLFKILIVNRTNQQHHVKLNNSAFDGNWIEYIALYFLLVEMAKTCFFLVMEVWKVNE